MNTGILLTPGMRQILEGFYKGGEESLSKLIFFCQVCLRALHNEFYVHC